MPFSTNLPRRLGWLALLVFAGGWLLAAHPLQPISEGPALYMGRPRIYGHPSQTHVYEITAPIAAVNEQGDGPPIYREYVQIAIDGNPIPSPEIRPAQPLANAVLFLVDVTMPPAWLTKINKELHDFAAYSLRPVDRVALWGFNQHAIRLTDEWQDGLDVADRIDSLTSSPNTPRCLDVALREAFDFLEHQAPQPQTDPNARRPALVVIGQGADLAPCKPEGWEPILSRNVPFPVYILLVDQAPSDASWADQLTGQSWGAYLTATEFTRLPFAFRTLETFLKPSSFVSLTVSHPPGSAQMTVTYTPPWGPEQPLTISRAIEFPQVIPYGLHVEGPDSQGLIRVVEEGGQGLPPIRSIEIRTTDGILLDQMRRRPFEFDPLRANFPPEVVIIALDEEGKELARTTYSLEATGISPTPMLMPPTPTWEPQGVPSTPTEFAPPSGITAPTPARPTRPENTPSPGTTAGMTPPQDNRPPETSDTGPGIKVLCCFGGLGMAGLALGALVAIGLRSRRFSWPFGKGRFRRLKPGPTRPPRPGGTPAPASPSSDAPRVRVYDMAYLEVLDSQDPAYPGRRWYLDTETLLVGRSVESDILFPLDDIQPVHARIRYHRGMFVVEPWGDAPSHAALFLNETRVTEAQPLRTGDVLVMGSTLRLRFVGPATASQPPFDGPTPPEE